MHEKHERHEGSEAAPTVSRRRVIEVLGAAGAATIAGRGFAAFAPAGAALLSGLDCVVTPPQTEGPYFVDGKLNRADIRTDPTSGKVSDGSPLRLRIAVARVSDAGCAPLPDAHVDVWQCDAIGAYSDVRDTGGQFDTRGQKFLRGYQLTNREGVAEFLTVYPGWYRGRAVHIHFKVRLFDGQRQTHEFTSQLYFDEALTDKVHAVAPYSSKGRRDTLNTRDGIFRQGGSGEHLMLRTDADGQGHIGTIAVGLRVP